jgi:hypothetical protein
MARIHDLSGALDLLREHRVVTVTPSGTLPSIVAQVAGGPIRGSWWSHPEGKLIFRISSALGQHPEALAVKLVDGKVTFVHRALWPALLRVVTDPGWRKQARAALGKTAQQLLHETENAGELHMADLDARVRQGKAELETSLLVHTRSEHTSAGKHETVLLSWGTWAKRTKATKAAGSVSDALAEIRNACQNRPTLLDPAPKRRVSISRSAR